MDFRSVDGFGICAHYVMVCRIGTEHEKFGFQLDNLQPMSYEQIRQLLEGLAERFQWQRVMEGDNIIGLAFVSSTAPPIPFTL